MGLKGLDDHRQALCCADPHEMVSHTSLGGEGGGGGKERAETFDTET